MGPIGLLSARWCQLEGARRVIAIDNVPERIALAKEKLGIEVINFDEVGDVVGEIKKMEPHGLDCAIDAVGFRYRLPKLPHPRLLFSAEVNRILTRYAKGIVSKVQRAVGLETDTSETVNECLRAVRKFGTISLIAVRLPGQERLILFFILLTCPQAYAAFTNGFLIGALMQKGIKLQGAGQASPPVIRLLRCEVF